MTCLIIVRHAEAEGNIIRRFHGQTDSHLTENGHKQAKKAAQRLVDESIDVLYSSDLSRAFQTAKYIGERKNLEVNQIKELREIHGGAWEDVPWDELPKKWPIDYKHWEEQPHLLQMPDGESMIDFQKRVVHAVMNIVQDNQDKNICIVTHGTVIKALLCYFYGKTLTAFNEIKWHDNASITIVNIQDDTYNVAIEGENMHLGTLSTLAKQDWWKKTENQE